MHLLRQGTRAKGLEFETTKTARGEEKGKDASPCVWQASPPSGVLFVLASPAGSFLRSPMTNSIPFGVAQGGSVRREYYMLSRSG
jgi:hypothetical protein